MRTDYLLVFGTFNPITEAHIALIKAARKQIRNKHVETILIPSNLDFMGKWKSVDKDFMTNKERLSVLTKVAQRYGYKVFRAEADGELNGKTYSTILAMNLPYDSKIYFCYGDDKIKEFPHWWRAKELFGKQNHIFLIATRLVNDKKCIAKFLKKQGFIRHFKVFSLDNPMMQYISSTDVRKAYAENNMEYIKDIVPKEVFQLLQQKRIDNPVKMCYFCKRPLSGFGDNNAEDYGLHPETIEKGCCNRCNALITITNRALSLVIKEPARTSYYIQTAIDNLEELKERSLKGELHS